MVHKHKWVYLKESEDWVGSPTTVINHGKYYKCSKCGEIRHIGASIIYWNTVIDPKHHRDPTEALPKYSLK